MSRHLRPQYLFYAALCLVALVLTALLLPSSGAYFSRFFGPVHPLLAVAGAAAAGGGALAILSRYGFAVLGPRDTWRGIGLSAALAMTLGVIAIIADIVIRYPRDLNVPLPQALAFYPAIGLVAEVAFHLLPLALLLPALGLLAGRLGRERAVWLAILAAAAFEPTFQVVIGSTGSPGGDLYTWLQIFVIAALQLYVFRRYGFASMYAFRLVYYACWHIAWGTIRLRLLF